MSGMTTQQLASRATSAGAQGVQTLGSAGTAGKWKGNTSRDLLRSLVKDSKMPPLYWAQVPMREPRTGNNNKLTWMPFLLVHEVLATMWKTYGDTLYDPSQATEKVLRTSCEANGINLLPSSSTFEDSRWRRGGREVVLPLGVHGDGVPNQASKTVVAFTWNILCKKKSERILLASLNKGIWEASL